MNIHDILHLGVEMEASDIHLTTGRPPTFRQDGQLVPVAEGAKLMPGDIRGLVEEMMDAQQKEQFMSTGDLDFAYSVPDLGRFRVNTFFQRGSIAAAIRRINSHIASLEELQLPSIVGELARRNHGLVLVTGPTGSGKSTTLAAMVDLINRERACHIITLEDPIEYMHSHKKSVVNQREIGSDTESFAKALRAAMRQDPDVILVGEMRDLDTISVAVTAAETGHLVFATLHTSGAAQTVDRIIDVFPPHQQQQIRVQLADTLQGIISQQLLKKVSGGRVAAVEVLCATSGVRNVIREGKTYQLINSIQTGGQHGMQSMDMSLKKLAQQGLISQEDMYGRLSGGGKSIY